MATKTIDGVRHQKRCACPVCDPGDRLAKQMRDESRAARRAWALAVAPIPVQGTAPAKETT